MKLAPLTDGMLPAVKALIAEAVLEFYGDDAAAFGYARIFLDTSHRCADAVRLFRRNGFADCAPYKESIGEVFLCRETGKEEPAMPTL